jgi:hypothetical protein
MNSTSKNHGAVHLVDVNLLHQEFIVWLSYDTTFEDYSEVQQGAEPNASSSDKKGKWGRHTMEYWKASDDQWHPTWTSWWETTDWKWGWDHDQWKPIEVDPNKDWTKNRYWAETNRRDRLARTRAGKAKFRHWALERIEARRVQITDAPDRSVYLEKIEQIRAQRLRTVTWGHVTAGWPNAKTPCIRCELLSASQARR